MKVLLINGSPHPRGCTDAALRTVAGALEERGLEAEILHLGAGPVRDCAACGACMVLDRLRLAWWEHKDKRRLLRSWER